MELRYFQIIVPLLALLIVGRQVSRYIKGKTSIYETILIFGFWVPVVVFTFFPDLFSNLIAKVFGIKNNVNATIFFALGVIIFFQFRLYKLIKKQDEVLTDLTRKIALEKPQGEQ